MRRTSINCTEEKNEYNKTEVPPLLAMVEAKLLWLATPKITEKKGESELPPHSCAHKQKKIKKNS
jgi:hypothetical protein